MGESDQGRGREDRQVGWREVLSDRSPLLLHSITLSAAAERPSKGEGSDIARHPPIGLPEIEINIVSKSAKADLRWLAADAARTSG